MAHLSSVLVGDAAGVYRDYTGLYRGSLSCAPETRLFGLCKGT